MGEFDFGGALDFPSEFAAPPVDFAGGGQMPGVGNLDVGSLMPPSWMGDAASAPGSPSGAPGWMETLFGSGRGGANVSPLSMLSQGLGLGAAGLGIANTIGAMQRTGAQEKVQQTGQQLATSAAQPAITYGTQQLDAAGKGQLPAPMEAAVAQWTDRAKADMRAKLAHLGLGDSSTLQLYEQQIDQMALSMKANLLQSQGSQGIAALGMGANAGLGIAQSGGQTQAQLNDLIAQADRVLGFTTARAA